MIHRNREYVLFHVVWQFVQGNLSRLPRIVNTRSVSGSTKGARLTLRPRSKCFLILKRESAGGIQHLVSNGDPLWGFITAEDSRCPASPYDCEKRHFSAEDARHLALCRSHNCFTILMGLFVLQKKTRISLLPFRAVFSVTYLSGNTGAPCGDIRWRFQ